MTTDLRNLPSDITGTAFRTWVQGIHDQLTAIGLVQTADTGQVNLATVTNPGATQTVAGYEMWRFNDALQATKPVFVKVEYGTHQTLSGPSARWTVGTGTNGAGTLTGQVGSTHRVDVYGKAGTLPSYCSGGPNRLGLFTVEPVLSGGGTYGMNFIERTKTAAGVDTGDGIIHYHVSPTTSVFFQVIPFAGSIPGGSNNAALDLSAGGQPVVGADIALSPAVAFLGKAFYGSWLAYRFADIAELVPVTVDHLGATRTYMPIGDGAPNTGYVLNAASNYSIAMLWE